MTFWGLALRGKDIIIKLQCVVRAYNKYLIMARTPSTQTHGSAVQFCLEAPEYFSGTDIRRWQVPGDSGRTWRGVRGC